MQLSSSDWTRVVPLIQSECEFVNTVHSYYTLVEFLQEVDVIFNISVFNRLISCLKRVNSYSACVFCSGSLRYIDMGPGKGRKIRPVKGIMPGIEGRL